MKLLIYSHFFSPSVGGVEVVVRSLAAGLTELPLRNGSKEFDVTVATKTKETAVNDARLPFRVVREPSLLQLWHLIRESDVVHIAGPALAPMILSTLARKPTIVEHHVYQAVCPNGLLLHQPDRTICEGHFQAGHYLECVRCLKAETSLTSAFARLLLMFPRHALSQKVARNLAVTQHVLKRLALPRSSVLYHGVEGCAQCSELPKAPMESSRRLSFAYVGRFVPEKGLSVLVEATTLLRREGFDLDIRLVGDGPERENLQSMISAQGLDSCVRITGYLTGPALVDSLRDVRVIVMPSICEETAGLAAIEQMMRGRLIIAANVGGLAEVLGEAGLKFPPQNADALASAMRRVLQDPTLIDSLGSKARDRAEHLFNRRKMIEEHADVYHTLVSDHSAAQQDAGR